MNQSSTDGVVVVPRHVVSPAVPLWAALSGVELMNLQDQPPLDERGGGAAARVATAAPAKQPRLQVRGAGWSLWALPANRLPHPGEALKLCLGELEVRFRMLDWSPAKPSGSWSDMLDWSTLTTRLAHAGGLILDCDHRDGDDFLRPASLWAAAAGLGIERKGKHGAYVRFQLVPVRPFGWLRSSSAAASLLASCVRFFDGPPVHTRICVAGSPLTDEPWLEALSRVGKLSDSGMRQAWASGNDSMQKRLPGGLFQIFIEPAAASIASIPTALTPRPRDAMRDVALALNAAQRTAPRGFVGLKFFRDRVLLPHAPLEQRRALLDAAIEESIVSVGSVVDGGTGSPAATLTLNMEHPVVMEVLGGSRGTLPVPLELRGQPLSATVISGRESGR